MHLSTSRNPFLYVFLTASTEMHLDLFVMFVHIPQGRGSSLSAGVKQRGTRAIWSIVDRGRPLA